MRNVTRIKSFTIFFSTISILVLSGLRSPISAAVFDLSPPTQTIANRCSIYAEIYVDTEGRNSNAAEIELRFDANRLRARRVVEGDAYSSYIQKNISNQNGIVKIGAISPHTLLNGKELFATVELEALASGSTIIYPYFASIGSSLDSNIAEANTNFDILTDVNTATINVTTDDQCVTDNEAPLIDFGDEYAWQLDSEKDTITLNIEDAQSGTELRKTKFIINGEIFTHSSELVSYTGNKKSYNFKLDIKNVTENNINFVTVHTVDYAGNKASQSIIFDTKIPSELTAGEIQTTLTTNPQDYPPSRQFRELQFTITELGARLLPETVTFTVNQNPVITELDFVETSAGLFQYSVPVDNLRVPDIEQLTIEANTVAGNKYTKVYEFRSNELGSGTTNVDKSDLLIDILPLGIIFILLSLGVSALSWVLRPERDNERHFLWGIAWQTAVIFTIYAAAISNSDNLSMAINWLYLYLASSFLIPVLVIVLYWLKIQRKTIDIRKNTP